MTSGRAITSCVSPGKRVSKHFHRVHLTTRAKANVESGVQLVQQWIVAALRQHRLYSVDEANQAICGDPLMFFACAIKAADFDALAGRYERRPNAKQTHVRRTT